MTTKPRRITRRTVLKAGLVGVPATAVAAGGGVGWWWASSDLNTFGEVEFGRSLTIPPLADSHLDGEGRRVFELTAQAGTTELRPGIVSDTWGFNGGYLGPTLRAARGEQVLINVHNDLDEATTVHWHGMHLPARMDGGPHQMVDPGESWSPTWTVDQPAATLWYHPHPHGETREHVNQGLAGLFILDDPGAETSGLPSNYGVDDIPVIVQDRSIDDSGDLRTGNIGDTVLVNGTYGPFLDVTTEAVRLRLLNGSNSRVYNFGFSDDREFDVIGSDGGLLSAPVERQRLALSPGERAEIVVWMQPGEVVVLRSYEPDLGVNWFTDVFDGGRDRLDLLELRAADTLDPSAPLPAALATAPALMTITDDEVTVNRRFELRGNTINGRSMDMGRIDEVVEVDTTEIWVVTNTDGEYHNFHVHDVQFQILEINDTPPPAEFAGWKDTVFVQPGDTARLVMRFTDHTDPDVPYMFHCHRLRHEDRGMMGQFVVVEPGQGVAQADQPERGDHGHDH
jgi:FtsP/CotA-like multicopper oxidase with cupredoxin domain